ncbi:hypothetical protein NMG60_11000621 [Bertholletia excelsa]
MGRAPCCDKAKVKKGPWSAEEDEKLKEYIEKNGTGGNWIALPLKADLKRCGKSCRLRWLNYLRPNIKHGEFSEDEDRTICTLFESIGSRWSAIAAQLPGRTDNDIKNYWNTKLKKKLMSIGMVPKPYHNQNRPVQSANTPLTSLLHISSSSYSSLSPIQTKTNPENQMYTLLSSHPERLDSGLGTFPTPPNLWKGHLGSVQYYDLKESVSSSSDVSSSNNADYLFNTVDEFEERKD